MNIGLTTLTIGLDLGDKLGYPEMRGTAMPVLAAGPLLDVPELPQTVSQLLRNHLVTGGRQAGHR